MITKYNSPQEEALELALSTRLKIVEGTSDILSIVRACFIIANNLSKEEDLKWIEGELNGHEKPSPGYRKITLPERLSGKFRDTTLSFPITTFEYYRTKNENLTIVCKNENDLTLRPDHCTEMIDSIINKCLKFLTSCIKELHYSGQIQSIFDNIRKEVDSNLDELDKEISNEMQSIYSNLTSPNIVDKPKVADSCRKILKYVADKLFPARVENYKLENGKELEVKDNKVLNRLICFFDRKHSKLVSSECNYLSNLNREVQDDTHKKEITQEEASIIALHTYLVLYEALKYLN